MASPVAGPGPGPSPVPGEPLPPLLAPQCCMSEPERPPSSATGAGQLSSTGAASPQAHLARTLSYLLQSGEYLGLHLSYSLPYLLIGFKHRWRIGVSFTEPPWNPSADLLHPEQALRPQAQAGHLNQGQSFYRIIRRCWFLDLPNTSKFL